MQRPPKSAVIRCVWAVNAQYEMALAHLAEHETIGFMKCATTRASTSNLHPSAVFIPYTTTCALHS